ncbi:MAG: NAD(P)/FAD-dependent oxidoreductase [Candidatus Omnitrophica bacterium]|jgi:hypothetical protein|nr:NAD(P)/FAD-dependent oxidoreductase [Candidatus Omnitrophota bacterium]
MPDANRVIVVGAGPAGMMASISAALSGADVTLIERNHLPGRKLLLSGKGRCNLTNACPMDEFFSHFNGKGEFLRDAFNSFFVEDLMDFFKKRGLGLKIERQNRVFPVSDKSASVLDVLEKEMRSKNVKLLTGVLFNDLIICDGTVKGVIVDSSKRMLADKVILCLGGASYPLTGSDGKWFTVLKRHGIGLSGFRPALTALLCRDNYGLNGLSLKNIRIMFRSSAGKALLTDIGEIVFTRKGISGPLVLSASAKVIDWLENREQVKAFLDMKPSLSEDRIQDRILRQTKISPNMSLRGLMRLFLPLRMSDVFLQTLGFDPDKNLSRLLKAERARVSALLKGFELKIKGCCGLETAIITRGGICLKGIDPRTMRSRKIKGLYFCGEMIDVDADTGGFNLQAAFSTGYLAGYSSAM